MPVGQKQYIQKTASCLVIYEKELYEAQGKLDWTVGRPVTIVVDGVRIPFEAVPDDKKGKFVLQEQGQ